MFKLKRSIMLHYSLVTATALKSYAVLPKNSYKINCTQKDWSSKSAIFFTVSFHEDGRLTTKTAFQKLRIQRNFIGYN